MSEVELRELFTHEGQQLLEKLTGQPTGKDLVKTVSKLRSAGHPPERVAAVLQQVQLRQAARAKFGSFADQLMYTPEGLEQATRLPVASVHAARFVVGNVPGVVDLGCGLGADSMAFTGAGVPVVSVEADEPTAAMATFNLTPLGVTVHHADATEFSIPRGWGVWADPARRTEKNGVTQKWIAPGEYSPSLEWLVSLAEEHPIGIKLSPAMNRDVIESLAGDAFEAQWVSHQGDVVEMTLWGGGLQRPGITRSALVLRDGKNASLSGSGDEADVPSGPIGKYVYEPDGAVIRSRLIHSLAQQLDARSLTMGMAYLTSDHYTETLLADAFMVKEVWPLDAKAISRELASRKVGKLEIKKRGVDVDPAEFRKRLKLDGKEEATLILTRIDGQRKAILATRIQ